MVIIVGPVQPPALPSHALSGRIPDRPRPAYVSTIGPSSVNGYDFLQWQFWTFAFDTGDRIAKVVHSPDGFAVEHDAVSGDIYLRLEGASAGTPGAAAGGVAPDSPGARIRVVYRDDRGTPLAAVPVPSRFRDPQARYAVLYAAETVRCAFWETLGRNGFARRRRRGVGAGGVDLLRRAPGAGRPARGQAGVHRRAERGGA